VEVEGVGEGAVRVVRVVQIEEETVDAPTVTAMPRVADAPTVIATLRAVKFQRKGRAEHGDPMEREGQATHRPKRAMLPYALDSQHRSLRHHPETITRLRTQTVPCALFVPTR
jgi:hypothetical protein